MYHHANDNARSPEEHRAIVAAQTINQPKGASRQYRSTRWPTAERHTAEDGGPYMTGALIGWRNFTAQPQVCVANDNFPEDSDAADPHAPEVQRRFDNRMDHDTADRTVALHAAGKPWQPGEERFDRPRRNDRAKAPPPPGSYRYNGIDLPQIEADAEDEANRVIDCASARRRLGHVCCRLLDLASGDSTRAEIAAAVKQPDGPRIDTYVDHAIISWMRDPAFAEYGMAA